VAAIRIVTLIAAPTDRCFDLARDIDFHTRSLAGTGEKAVAGRTSGLIEHGESVTWEARHLGVRQRFTAEVTVFDRPLYFRDVMTAGAFRSFAHDHRFEERDGKTVMTDEVAFRSPLGPRSHSIKRPGGSVARMEEVVDRADLGNPGEKHVSDGGSTRTGRGLYRTHSRGPSCVLSRRIATQRRVGDGQGAVAVPLRGAVEGVRIVNPGIEGRWGQVRHSKCGRGGVR
jgi:ligand-binding SRPBCC domain-containing protein